MCSVFENLENTENYGSLIFQVINTISYLQHFSKRSACLWLNFQSIDYQRQRCNEAYLFKRQSHKMAKHTQTICRQIPDELSECV